MGDDASDRANESERARGRTGVEVPENIECGVPVKGVGGANSGDAAAATNGVGVSAPPERKVLASLVVGLRLPGKALMAGVLAWANEALRDAPRCV